MTQLQDNNQQEQTSSSWQENLSESIASNIGNAIGKIISFIIFVGTALYVVNNVNSISSLLHFEISDPQTFLPLGISTGLLLYLTAILGTPVSVAFFIGAIIYLFISKLTDSTFI